jgi:hypothetical protein
VYTVLYPELSARLREPQATRAAHDDTASQAAAGVCASSAAGRAAPPERHVHVTVQLAAGRVAAE